jgi:hypothetical protein
MGILFVIILLICEISDYSLRCWKNIWRNRTPIAAPEVLKHSNQEGKIVSEMIVRRGVITREERSGQEDTGFGGKRGETIGGNQNVLNAN